MNTHRETILHMVVSLIGALGLPVYRSRATALDRDELPAVVVKPGGEQSTRLGNQRMSRAFRVLVEVHAKADSTPSVDITADQSADAVIATIHKALFADPTFGGIVGKLIDVEMQEPIFVDADETRVAITLVYEATYATAERDITTTTNH